MQAATAAALLWAEAKFGIAIDAVTLYRWQRRWNRAQRGREAEALADGRGKPRQKTVPLPFLEAVKNYYLRPTKIPLARCIAMAMVQAEEQGWETRGYDACRRHVKSIPFEVLALGRGGQKEYDDKARGYLPRGCCGRHANHVWFSDHHQWDVIIRDGQVHCRPWLTIWQDGRSRMIVGFSVYAHNPNSDEILYSFRAAVLAWGVPESVYIDNGKDYDCYALNGRTKRDRWQKRTIRPDLDQQRAGVFPGLGIEVIHARPYNARAKICERLFGTLENSVRAWPTYCGRSPLHKPDDLQLQIERGNAPTLEEFASWAADLVKRYNESDPHHGDGMGGKTPAQVYEETLIEKRTATAEMLDFFCLRVTPLVKVSRNGVRFGGECYRLEVEDQIQWQGKEVILRIDDADLGVVQVWSTDGRYIGLATHNRRIAFNSEEYRAAQRELARRDRGVKDYLRIRPKLMDDLPDVIVRQRAAKLRAKAEQTAAAAPTIKPVQTGIDPSQIAKAQAATARRRQRGQAGRAMLRQTGTDDVVATQMQRLQQSLDGGAAPAEAAESAEAAEQRERFRSWYTSPPREPDPLPMRFVYAAKQEPDHAE
jgi:hypothetical protein